MSNESMPKWYISGLSFQCQQCGNCCSGPNEGYIWITRPEIEKLAGYLGITVEQLHKKHLRRIGNRISIIEEPASKDCIFLTKAGCGIYPARPNQCRTWPFWPGNLTSAEIWNLSTQKCPGVNHGRKYSYGQIEKLKKQKKWWGDEDKK